MGLNLISQIYSALSVSSSTIKPCDSVDIRVTVTNTGKVAGSEVIQICILFLNIFIIFYFCIRNNDCFRLSVINTFE